MKLFGISDRGKVRSENQDSYVLYKHKSGKRAFMAVCDGMGGARAGEVASELACHSFEERMHLYIDEKSELESMDSALRSACRIANSAVYRRGHTDTECRGMGTTLVGAVVKGSKCLVANVGDSRAYRISNGKIELVTKDHSFVQALVDRGELTAEEARTHPRKNIITRVLGTEEAVDADIFEVTLKKNDRLLLCSDGLSNMLEENELLKLGTDADIEQACSSLIAAALERGAPDNVTVLIAAN